jgi:flavin-dependent dehydrogenase
MWHGAPASYPSHAIVIGASIAGLVTARVLVDHFDQVTVLDRDKLPTEPVSRAGVPQGRHSHGLLARGLEALEEIFPGFTDDLRMQGAVVDDLQDKGRWFHGGRMLRQSDSGLMGLCVSRPLLEGYLREVVRHWPRVTVHEGASVLDLVFDDLNRRVVGVRVADMVDDAPAGEMRADLVVDASGRMSRTPAWLERRRFQAPREEKVRVDLAYATRTFRRRPGQLDGQSVLVCAASADTPRAGALLAQEGERWTASVAGYHGERPPTELADFLDYCERLANPAMANALRTFEPLDDGATYRFTANVRRRYEELERFPAGLLVTGDALCSIDPVHWQGITTAALEALTLRRCLAAGRADLAERFFRAAGRLIDSPWSIAVVSDLDLTDTEGGRTRRTRLTNRYVRMLRRAAADDAILATAYLRVANLKTRPESLLAPRLVARVLRSNVIQRPAGDRRAAPALSAGP